MQSRQRWNFAHWSLSTKFTVLIFFAVALPGMLLLVPYTLFQRNANIQNQHSAYLDTVAPYALAQIEDTLTALSDELEYLVYAPEDYTQLEDLLYRAPYTTSESAQQALERFIEQKTTDMVQQAPSLSRVRFLDPGGRTLVDVTFYGGVYNVRYEVPEGESSPANTLIANNQLGPNSTVSDVYPDSRGTPAIDVILPLRPPWDRQGTEPAIGLVIFTQDLTQASDDNLLPNLLDALKDLPQPDYPAHMFLLNENSALLAPNDSFEWFADMRSSEGYQLAQRGVSTATTYDSAILEEEVIARPAVLNVRYLPRLTLLIETPVDQLRREALRDSILILIGYAVGFVGLALIVLYLGRSIIIQPIVQLTHVAREISTGNLAQAIQRQERRDEIGELNNAFDTMARQLLGIISELEIRLSTYTQTQETIQAIAHILSGAHTLDTQLDEAVTLIQQRFGPVYHAQVFLIDPTTRTATLRASTGQAGRTLLRQGHTLAIGSKNTIDAVATTGQRVIVPDTAGSDILAHDALLPDTRAEIMLPLRMGGHVIGVLDLQSTMPHAFSEQDAAVFQSIADQISIAVDRAKRLAEMQQRQHEIERLNQVLMQAVWEETTAQLEPEALSAASGEIVRDYKEWTSLQLEAMQTLAIAERVEGNTVHFAVPVTLRGQALGAVEWQIPRAQYTAETRQTAQELADRLALSVENLRLFEQSRRAAQRELLVNQISSKLIGTTDIDQILQTAVRELGLALHVPRTTIRLNPPASRAADTTTDSQDE